MYVCVCCDLQTQSKSLFLVPGFAHGSVVLHQSVKGGAARGEAFFTMGAPGLPAFQEPAAELLQNPDYLSPNSTGSVQPRSLTRLWLWT